MSSKHLKSKVSVSIITYNHEKYLRACLESIVTQKCDFDFEIVVGEDCSPDNTRAVLKEFQQKYPHVIKPIYQEKNVGHYQNFIDVIDQCQGEYIANIDGDDCMLPGKLQKQVDFLDEHSECAVVFHNLRFIGALITTEAYNNSLDEKSCIVDINDFVDKGLAHWGNASKMYRRSSYPPEGTLSALKCIGDQHLHLQNARTGKVAYLAEVLGLYRKHAEGLSQVNKRKDQITCALHDLVLTYSNAYKYGVKKEIVDNRLAFIYFDTACQYLQLNDYKKFKFYIEKSYENKIYFNQKHKICFMLKQLPQILYILKLTNNIWYKIKRKQTI